DAHQDVANRFYPAERQQQLDGALADIARAPAASRVLLEAARRQVVDARVADEPRHDRIEIGDVGRARRLDCERAVEPPPEALGVGTGGATLSLQGARTHRRLGHRELASDA